MHVAFAFFLGLCLYPFLSRGCDRIILSASACASFSFSFFLVNLHFLSSFPIRNQESLEEAASVCLAETTCLSFDCDLKQRQCYLHRYVCGAFLEKPTLNDQATHVPCSLPMRTRIKSACASSVGAQFRQGSSGGTSYYELPESVRGMLSPLSCFSFYHLFSSPSPFFLLLLELRLVYPFATQW